MKKNVTFKELFRESWNIFSSKFWLLLSIGALFGLLPVAIFNIFGMDKLSNTLIYTHILQSLQALYPWMIGLWLFSTFFNISIIYLLNNDTKKDPINFKKALAGGFRFYWKGLLLGLLLFIFLIPLYFILLIPGIIFQTYWIFSFYILVRDKKSVMDSIRESFNVVKGNWWKVFWFMTLFYIIIEAIGFLSSSIFHLFGTVGVLLQATITTLTSIFSLVFVNAFYSSMKK